MLLVLLKLFSLLLKQHSLELLDIQLLVRNQVIQELSRSNNFILFRQDIVLHQISHHDYLVGEALLPKFVALCDGIIFDEHCLVLPRLSILLFLQLIHIMNQSCARWIVSLPFEQLHPSECSYPGGHNHLQTFLVVNSADQIIGVKLALVKLEELKPRNHKHRFQTHSHESC